MPKTNDQKVNGNVARGGVKSGRENRLENFSDNELFQMCKAYGLATLMARRKFLGLLPEVNRRELWRIKGFRSIGHFAAKLAGVTKKQLRKVINLEKRFVDLPILHQQLVSGEVSCNKLVRVAAVVTKGNEEFWANQTKNLSQKGLETLVRDQRAVVVERGSESREVLRAQTLMSEELTNLVDVKLPLDVAKKLEEMTSKGLDIAD